MSQFLTHVELSRSMAAILAMPQYVVYQKNVWVVCLFVCFLMLLLNSVQSLTVFNILCTMDFALAAPTMISLL